MQWYCWNPSITIIFWEKSYDFTWGNYRTCLPWCAWSILNQLHSSSKSYSYCWDCFHLSCWASNKVFVWCQRRIFVKWFKFCNLSKALIQLTMFTKNCGAFYVNMVNCRGYFQSKCLASTFQLFFQSIFLIICSSLVCHHRNVPLLSSKVLS